MDVLKMSHAAHYTELIKSITVHEQSSHLTALHLRTITDDNNYYNSFKPSEISDYPRLLATCTSVL